VKAPAKPGDTVSYIGDLSSLRASMGLILELQEPVSYPFWQALVLWPSGKKSWLCLDNDAYVYPTAG
jgi:hypothetical protein